jgi:hypothetical protein
MKRQAAREDLPFVDLIQADLLVLLMALITPGVRWFPQLMYYASYGSEFPLFLRAIQHKHFKRLAVITGIADGTALREAVSEGRERSQVQRWHDFHWDLSSAMNLEKLDTIQ